ncbi:MAG: hypothetical protein OSJ65_08270 [Bacilli bacterium]|nr:hypothetical protein [Bacilli bacterium]
MNTKVVIIWIFAIVILAGMGVFGYLNQDLLLLENNEYVPIVAPEATAKTCTLKTENSDSIYRFTIKNEEITAVWISYASKIADIEGYEIANKLATEVTTGQIKGLASPGLQGGSSDFSLNVQFNPKDYDKARVEELTPEFTKLSMIIDTISSYDIYKQALTDYVCE